MRLIGLTVENFRCYAAPISVRFNDLTALVGRNDVGKSTLMDALSIFFDTTNPDKDDASKNGDPKLMRISCEFDQLPASIVVDAEFPTTLASEFLLSRAGTLVVRKTYNGALASPKASSIEAIAMHPTTDGYNDLLALRKADLSKRAAALGIELNDVDKRANAPVRSAIWASCDDLQLAEVPVSLEVEGGKQVWAALQRFLPTFALFKSDRASTDQDAEAQDPLKAAIREAIREVEPKLQEVKDYVEAEVKKIAAATVDKLREMDASIAETLAPIVTTKKWDTLFSTSITGDEGIPLNKRGSGVKRLVLLNFFRAQAEKNAVERNSTSIIYAIEEPETSQHPRNQRLLLKALRELAAVDGRQVIITTHTPMLSRHLPEGDVRFIRRNDVGLRSIDEGSPEISEEMAKSLGVLPDHNVKVFIGVEGPHDISFLTAIARILRAAGEDVPDLERLEVDGELIFIPLGGSNLAVWSSRLKALNRPELHICDRDNPPPANPKYHDHMVKVNARPTCLAVATNKRELENYLHHEAINEFYAENGAAVAFGAPFADFDDVPQRVAEAAHLASGGAEWANVAQDKRSKKMRQAKSSLNNGIVAKMTADRLTQTDPDNEIRNWFGEVSRMIAEFDA
ncbi:ATP-binding protein [Thioclava indica]|nr:ATP-binding protein [Thioclava indica]